MIDNKCFTTEWIETKAKELNYSDTNLIEKVIRALSLLDMLARSGCRQKVRLVLFLRS